RHGEFQVTQLGAGGDLLYKNVMGRLMTQFGMYSETTPRNDASPARGQWNLDNAYRYISEAYGGYHLDWLSGVNIQFGIFMSYVGLWSYYNFDNWTYQPSYVSSNTPWFFNGGRIQIYTSEKLKIEPWLVNGWQAYGVFNEAPGLGLQIRWWPNDWFSALGNQYYGTDDLGLPHRKRFHTDDSGMVKYYENKETFVTRMACSLTIDYGFEKGEGVTANNQYFLGWMAYDRTWFLDNKFAFTFGGGWISNPGRYLVLEPPINGATAFTGSPYFTENPGNPFRAWDFQTTADYMPTENITFRLEFTRRFASVPYWSGRGGVTPPNGSVTNPDGTVTLPGGGEWFPDLRKSENIITMGFLVRY
ncbi:MAG TPA: outer membrane beta-barrel protein, partial [Planctomycetota bacterium]|nr:outer membrane beta-barrel protein [Planctomycetota bacterium]